MEEEEVKTKSVRVETPPDYIPVLNLLALKDHAARKAINDTENAPRKIHANVIQKLNKGPELIDIASAAKLFMQTKQLAARARSGKAARYLQKKHLEFETEMLNSYNLSEIHSKMRRRKQVKVACIQKMFIDNLPKQSESVKGRIVQKIDLLQRMKSNNSFITETKQETDEDQESVALSMEPFPNPRRRNLRRSVDLTNCPVDLLDYEVDTTASLNMADIERELAIARSREKIETELELPFDRMARLTTLQQNVARIDRKFRNLQRGNKNHGNRRDDAKFEEEKSFLAPSRFTQPGMAKARFRRHARIVLIVLNWIRMIINTNISFERELKSFVDIATEIEEQTISTQMEESGLHFDKKYYKANTEITLSQDVRKTLTTRWQWRTDDMVKQALNGLQSLRSLLEYPISTQEKLCKVAWYQTIDAKKPIVRQGHPAESFYFILSGSAIVKKLCQDKSGESRVEVAARLRKGQSFGFSWEDGEIGLLFNTKRTATVESISPMELLVIGKDDFINIFMKSEDPTEDGDHIKFLKQLPCLQNWPFSVLKSEAGACLLHYFKRGSLVTDCDRRSEYIYFIKMGSCEVLKRLRAVKPRHPKERRPKSHPYTDVILPELGMPNNQPRIDTGRNRQSKVVMHPDVFNEMTEFYESLRRVLPTTEKVNEKFRPATRDRSKDEHQVPANVFVRVELLQAKDSFGLNTLKHYTDDADDMYTVDGGDSPLLALVSRGAEVVMLSKRVFLKYANNKVRLNLRDHIRVYPPESVMQENMQNAADWGLYKEQLVTDFLQTKNKPHRSVSVSDTY